MKNKRLLKIANHIQEGMIVADIGTDHAFLPVYLMKNKMAKKAYACDVVKGPLEAAKKSIQEANLQQQIDIILSDGFENVPLDANVAVIAGMGYHTAVKILEDAKERLPHFEQIFIEINKDVQRLRQYISDHNYTIRNEYVVEERGFFYIIIEMDCTFHEAYAKEEILYGTASLFLDDEFPAYQQKRIEQIKALLSKVKDEKKRVELKNELAYWQK